MKKREELEKFIFKHCQAGETFEFGCFSDGYFSFYNMIDDNNELSIEVSFFIKDGESVESIIFIDDLLNVIDYSKWCDVRLVCEDGIDNVDLSDLNIK